MSGEAGHGAGHGAGAGHEANPSFDCITGGHLLFDIHDQHGQCVGGWCAWCGTGARDADRITDDGTAVGFVPTLKVRVPAHFHRQAAA